MWQIIQLGQPALQVLEFAEKHTFLRKVHLEFFKDIAPAESIPQINRPAVQHPTYENGANDKRACICWVIDSRVGQLEHNQQCQILIGDQIQAVHCIMQNLTEFAPRVNVFDDGWLISPSYEQERYGCTDRDCIKQSKRSYIGQERGTKLVIIELNSRSLVSHVNVLLPLSDG